MQPGIKLSFRDYESAAFTTKQLCPIENLICLLVHIQQTEQIWRLWLYAFICFGQTRLFFNIHFF